MTGSQGTVYLVGAGPGDPELMTLRAMRLLQQANLVIHDRLIPMEVLTWCQPQARLIDVGKYPDHHRVSQAEINQLLVKHALRGEIVIRLKGGDPFVFGRGQEEIDACRAAGVRTIVVPGVSSCIAGPSAVGIPVTTRGIARTFTVVTGQTDPALECDIDFAALAKMDTVVVLMGRKNLGQLMSKMVAAGQSGQLPVVCIENATLPNQRCVVGTLANIATKVDEVGLKSPMVTVVGEVASMVTDHSAWIPIEIKTAIRSY